MKEVFILVVGFAAATKLWLAAFDLNSYRKNRDQRHITIMFRGLARIGVALTMGILAYALAQADTIEVSLIGLVYLGSAILLLIGTVGELNTYDWEDGPPKGPK